MTRTDMACAECGAENSDRVEVSYWNNSRMPVDLCDECVELCASDESIKQLEVATTR